MWPAMAYRLPCDGPPLLEGNPLEEDGEYIIVQASSDD